MYVRLGIYIICALIVAGLFLFNSAFNWGGEPGVSMYAQAIREGQIFSLFVRALFPAFLVFIGLLTYFGLQRSEAKPKTKKKNKEAK